MRKSSPATTFRATLLAGAAAFLLTAAPAAARDSVVVSVEGRFVIGAADEYSYALDEAPPYPAQDLDDGYGIGGKGSILYRWDSGWNAAIAFSALGTHNSERTAPGYGYSFYYTGFYGPAEVTGHSETSVYMLDFEVGHDFGVGSGNLRLFGGVRLSWLDRDTTVTTAYYPGDYYPRIEREDTSWGVGPRIGAEMSYPVGGGFGVFAGLSGAVLFGEQSTYQEGQFLGFPVTPEVDEDESNTMWSADGEIGVSYSFGFTERTMGTLSLGYRAEVLYNALNNEYPIAPAYAAAYGTTTDDKADYLSHGPFLRLSVTF